jgi:NADH:ubiquinone oxidoreductase subunit E
MLPKATVAQLSEMLVSIEQVVVVKPKKARAPSKEELRTLFDANGCVTTADIEAIAARLGVKVDSVRTAISDLQSEKWARGPALKIEKAGENYILSTKSP